MADRSNEGDHRGGFGGGDIPIRGGGTAQEVGKGRDVPGALRIDPAELAHDPLHRLGVASRGGAPGVKPVAN